jgi:hypothetical protein
MDLPQREDRSSGQDRHPTAGPTVALEPTCLRVRMLGLAIEVNGSTAPQSPKSLAACLLLYITTMLGLTCGLAVLCHWLGGSLSVCLAAAGIGLTISLALVMRALAFERFTRGPGA